MAEIRKARLKAAKEAEVLKMSVTDAAVPKRQ
jgi:hypothetical protein